MLESAPESTNVREILNPTELNRLARDLIEDTLSLIWVEGEISNFAKPASGHIYFTLKDAQAQVRCAMFRPKSQFLRFKPSDGMRVLLRAKASLYEGRGEFQLLVDHLEEAGAGALQRAFEELKAKLKAEGLFDLSHKRALPKFPRSIGIITSASGAAVRDVISVAKRRFPLIDIDVLPVPVQGTDAAPAIIAMLHSANAARRHDVLLLTRGGGSLEDLWAFNDEALARAIRSSTIPIVAAIGHEVDFTIAEFVADLRAATPSAAAEIMLPDAGEWTHRLHVFREHMRRSLQRKLQSSQQRLDLALTRLNAQLPQRRLERSKDRLLAGWSRLRAITGHRLEQRALRLGQLARTLNAVSPLATMERGYAILLDADRGHVIRSITQTKSGAQIHARVSDGEIRLRVQDSNE